MTNYSQTLYKSMVVRILEIATIEWE